MSNEDKTANVTFRHMPHSEKMEELCQEHAEKLFKLSSRLTSCNVVFEGHPHHDDKSVVRSMTLRLSLPGDEIAVQEEVENDHNPDAGALIRNAFAHARRIVNDHAEKRRDRTRH